MNQQISCTHQQAAEGCDLLEKGINEVYVPGAHLLTESTFQPAAQWGEIQKKTAWFVKYKSQIPKPRETKAARISRTD